MIGQSLYLSLKISISPRSSVIASSDKSASHFSGVLGCFGLGSLSPAPGIIEYDLFDNIHFLSVDHDTE